MSIRDVRYGYGLALGATCDRCGAEYEDICHYGRTALDREQGEAMFRQWLRLHGWTTVTQGERVLCPACGRGEGRGGR